MSLNTPIRSTLRRGGLDSTTNSEGVAHPPYETNTSSLPARLWDVFLGTFDLGFTAFGGPPVHFQIFHRRFVDGVGKRPWIDEQTYQELFAISQALPGPASTKMLFNIAQIHAGVLPALLVFLLWSLPTAIAMFALSLGVSRISEALPEPVYALLSGLNSATVGIIALAAMQLARKAITDKLTRLLVVFGACAGMCYNALWYFPVLLVGVGALTVGWDFYGKAWVNKLRTRHWRRRSPEPSQPESGLDINAIPMEHVKSQTEIIEAQVTIRRQGASVITSATSGRGSVRDAETHPTSQPSGIDVSTHRIPVKFGIILIAFFFAAFTIFISLRGALHPAPLILALFNNFFLAGTIIFGGGPVVIPLLRDYVVDPGWVSPRDFLLGLAVIQAMPGPNFNFGVYLGALVAARNSSVPSIVGALLAFVGIFTPGLWLSIGFQSIWHSLRKRREVASILRGVNAAAVGFVFTAVYRLWKIGYLTASETKGMSLGTEPWWLVIAASTFTAVEWFSTPPPVAILTGGAAGLAWWGAVGRHFSQQLV